MYSRKFLKSKSRKELFSMISDLEIKLGKIWLELLAEETVHKVTKQAIESAENALVYKEKEIEHKDRLLKALIQS